MNEKSCGLFFLFFFPGCKSLVSLESESDVIWTLIQKVSPEIECNLEAKCYQLRKS